MKKISFGIVFLSLPLFGQVKITDAPDVQDIHAESLLHLESTAGDKGFLQVRLALTSTTSASPLSAHKQGMIVYNTATVNDVLPGLYMNDGARWVKLGTILPEGYSPELGDVKNGFQASDHNGWYLLDGRNISSLPATARNNAAALGFTTTLSDLKGRYIKNKTNAEATKVLTGEDTFKITKANLPNGNFSGSTSTTGAHNHSFPYTGSRNIRVKTDIIDPREASTTVQFSTPNLSNEGSHNHTVSFSLGGSDVSVNKIPSYITTNIFIYLGT